MAICKLAPAPTVRLPLPLIAADTAALLKDTDPALLMGPLPIYLARNSALAPELMVMNPLLLVTGP